MTDQVLVKRKWRDLATQIKQIEQRLDELRKALVVESDVRKKLDMQLSYKANAAMLKNLKEQFWAESATDQNIKTRNPGL